MRSAYLINLKTVNSNLYLDYCRGYITTNVLLAYNFFIFKSAIFLTYNLIS